MSYYTDLSALIQTHPDWPSVPDEDLLVWVNEVVINATKTNLPNAEILAVILEHRAEFAALSDSDKQLVRDILYIGDSVPTLAGEPARDTLVAIFGGNSQTIQALAQKITYLVSRAVEAGIIQSIRMGDIEEARRIS